MLSERGHDVIAAGLVDELKQLDDPILFAVSQGQRRVLITHNVHDFPDILRAWAEAGRSHHGCILSFVPTNAYGEMGRRFDRWFEQFPLPSDWIDRVARPDACSNEWSGNRTRRNLVGEPPRPGRIRPGASPSGGNRAG